jgi:hypothetical protein
LQTVRALKYAAELEQLTGTTEAVTAGACLQQVVLHPFVPVLKTGPLRWFRESRKGQQKLPLLESYAHAAHSIKHLTDSSCSPVLPVWCTNPALD